MIVARSLQPSASRAHAAEFRPRSGRVDPDALARTSDSSTREKVIEHLFLGELPRCHWTEGRRDIEVRRGEVDKGGYDLVVARG